MKHNKNLSYMFLFSTQASSILQTFACDGPDISFFTWYDSTFVTPYILAESYTATIFSLSPLANLSCNKGVTLNCFWLPTFTSFFIRHTYQQIENLPLPWLSQPTHPKSFASYKHYYCTKFLDTCSVFFWATY